MTGEKPGSINDLAAETGRDPHDPSVFAEFTQALGQWRRQWLEEELVTEGIVGRFLDRHLAGSSALTPSDLPPLDGYWQPTTAADTAAIRAARELPLLSDEALRMTPIPEERHSCDG
jgi:hypothetical protein